MRILAVTGLKGGVGKTSTAVNLAAVAAELGHRTVLWDLDPQGAATHCVAAKAKLRGGAIRLVEGGRGGLAAVTRATDVDGLRVVPADTSVRDIDRLLWAASKPTKMVRKLVAGLKSDADVLVLDCPPGLSPLVQAVASVADLLLVPVVPEPLPFRALGRYREFLADSRAASPEIVAPFLSMVDRRKPMHRRIEAQVRADGRFLATVIPESSAVARMGEEQVPAVVSSPRSLAGLAYRQLWGEATERAGL